MTNTNILTATKVFDSRLWGGVSDADTAWQTGAATGTISMAVVEVVIDDGDLASIYELDFASNPVTGTEIIAILGIFSTTAAGNAITAAGNISTTTDIKWLPTAADGVDTTYRLVFLYR